MKRTDPLSSLSRQKLLRVLIALGFLYMLLVVLEVPFVLKNGPTTSTVSLEGSITGINGFLDSEENLSPHKLRPERKIKELRLNQPLISRLNLTAGIGRRSSLQSAERALELGRKLWREVEFASSNQSAVFGNRTEITKCPDSISIAGNDQFSMVVLPCGLTLGSHITVIGKPRAARNETDGPKISNPQEEEEEEDYMNINMVSQFVIELVGLKMAEDEEPPKVLQINPRLRGDWSGKPVIELNTCYRMQCGRSQRCQGWRSTTDEDDVDGLVKCERWSRDDDINGSEPKRSMLAQWLNRLAGRDKKRRRAININWPFPFAEEKLFVLTLSAGFEGYHMNVDGRHVTSFPYRPGFTLEDATGLSITGDIDVVSVFAASLPTVIIPHKHLELSDRLRAPSIPDGPVELFIGIISSANHFSERMAVRKSWMQHELIKSSRVVVVRFIVALHRKKEVNIEVKKEAEFFGDIVVVPYLDHYDLVVLKTVAICEFGVRTVHAKYIMKGDDDTFIRVDAIIDEVKKVEENKIFYMGNMNFHYNPLRSGKWAVTDEEWPEEVYPTYADGPGYIISSDIASFILSDFENNKLRLFKMEDVSMGMWVEKFNKSTPVEYVHSLKFCQFGCIEDYITAHYQSPKLMICLWNKLRRLGKPTCCNTIK
ncbi:hypothetical protein OROHE_008465 [Orobanche hederae]